MLFVSRRPVNILDVYLLTQFLKISFNYSSDSRTVTFCDLLSNLRKNAVKNTTKPGNSPGLLHFLTFVCVTVTTLYVLLQ